jgi:hypothetical protein
MNEWKDLPTMQSVVEAQNAGEEIQRDSGCGWQDWNGSSQADQDDCAAESVDVLR